MLGMLCIAILYAFQWPRRASWIQNTAVGRHLNNFNWFRITHVLMLVTLIVCLFNHPPPNFAVQLPMRLAPFRLPQVKFVWMSDLR